MYANQVHRSSSAVAPGRAAGVAAFALVLAATTAGLFAGCMQQPCVTQDDCPAGFACLSGRCLPVDNPGDGQVCRPSCSGVECGPDGCGDWCAVCPANQACVEHRCENWTAPGTFPDFSVSPLLPQSGQKITATFVSLDDRLAPELEGTSPCGGIHQRRVPPIEVRPGVWRWTFDVGVATGGSYSLALVLPGNPAATLRRSVSVSAGTDCSQYLPPDNPFGIGFVNPGTTAQVNLAKELAGDGGHVLLVFAGVDLNTTVCPGDWKQRVQEVYNSNLIPVVRIGPGAGAAGIRYSADPGTNYRKYSALAQKYKLVVDQLPRRHTWPLYVQIHNEPNLCYEWACREGTGNWINSDSMAAEYASYFRDVADAIHSSGDSRVKVSLGAMAPGGAATCECCQDCRYTAGDTGLMFLEKMRAEVPSVWSRLDYLASHSYPAEGVGWGFFVPFDRARVGLTYFESELATIGRDLPVLITETGWSTKRPDPACPGNNPCPTEDQKAAYTRSAWEQIWLPSPKVRGVMPFMLQDWYWGDDQGFGWVRNSDGNHLPVFGATHAARCAHGIGPGC